MSANLHFSNGALLLKDINTDNWYYVGVTIVDNEPYISIEQEAADIALGVDYKEYVVLKASNGTYYKVYVYSLESVIYSNPVVLETPEPPNRVLLRSSTGILYELAMLPDGLGDNYLAVRLASSNPTVETCNPWRAINNVTACASRSINPISSYCEREVITVE